MEELINEFKSRKEKVDKYLNLATEIISEINSQCALDLKVTQGKKCLFFKSEYLCLNTEVKYNDIAIGLQRNGNDLKETIAKTLKYEMLKNRNS